MDDFTTGSARRRLAAGLALAVLCGGCGTKEEPSQAQDQVQETGKELSKNPLAAAAQLAQAAQQVAEDAKRMEEKKPVDPVKFDVLLPFLPRPDGWTAEEPQGQTTQMGEWKITVVSGDYRKGGGEGENPPPEQHVRIEITDGGYVPMAYMPFKMMSQLSTESTDGWQKGVTVDGHPGFEKWEKKNQSTEIWALVADRFLVHLSGDTVTAEELRQWTGLLRLGEMAKLQ